MFTLPPPSRFDLHFSILGIPVRVHPLFWVIAILLGSSSNNLMNILIWIIAIFISILLHELGHALAMRQFGQRSQIVLHASGGLTIPEPVAWGSGWANVALTPNQEIFITLAGPGTGFLFAALILALTSALGGTIVFTTILGFIPMPIAGFSGGNSIINLFIGSLLWVNIFWGLINLMPIYPLDGGNVARHLFIKADPWNGVRKSLWLSVIAGGIIAVVGFAYFGSIYMGLMFGFLAFQSYQMLQGGMGKY
jgi:Zn-dependent protease